MKGKSTRRGRLLRSLREKASLSKAALARLVQAHEDSGSELESYIRRIRRFESGKTQKLHKRTLDSLVFVFGIRGLDASGLRHSPTDLECRVWELPSSIEPWTALAYRELMWTEGQGETDWDDEINGPVFHPPDIDKIQRKAELLAQSMWHFYQRTEIRWAPETLLDFLFRSHLRYHIDEIWYRTHFLMQDLDESDFEAAYIWAMWLSRKTLMKRASDPTWESPSEPEPYKNRTLDQILLDAERFGPITGGDWFRSQFPPFIFGVLADRLETKPST